VQHEEAEHRDFFFDDVEVLDFAGPFEVFSRTGLASGVESRRSDVSAPFHVFTGGAIGRYGARAAHRSMQRHCRESASETTQLRPSSLLERRLAEPLAEPDVAESRLAPRNQRAFTEFGPEVPGLRIGDNLARVVVGGKALTDQFIETELLRTGHFNSPVDWGTHGDRADRLRDVLSRHRLKEHRWYPDRRSDGGVIRNAFDELEELRGVNDRVRDSPLLINAS